MSQQSRQFAYIPAEIKRIYMLKGLTSLSMPEFNELKKKYGCHVSFFETYFVYKNGSWHLSECVQLGIEAEV